MIEFHPKGEHQRYKTIRTHENTILFINWDAHDLIPFWMNACPSEIRQWNKKVVIQFESCAWHSIFGGREHSLYFVISRHFLRSRKYQTVDPCLPWSDTVSQRENPPSTTLVCARTSFFTMNLRKASHTLSSGAGKSWSQIHVPNTKSILLNKSTLCVWSISFSIWTCMHSTERTYADNDTRLQFTVALTTLMTKSPTNLAQFAKLVVRSLPLVSKPRCSQIETVLSEIFSTLIVRM